MPVSAPAAPVHDLRKRSHFPEFVRSRSQLSCGTTTSGQRPESKPGSGHTDLAMSPAIDGFLVPWGALRGWLVAVAPSRSRSLVLRAATAGEVIAVVSNAIRASMV